MTHPPRSRDHAGLVGTLLLLNQFPDIAADASVGRRHFPIAYGARRSALMYALFAALAILALGTIQHLGLTDPGAWYVLLPMLLLVPVMQSLARAVGGGTRPSLGSMAANVALTVTTPALLGLSFLLG